MEAEAAKLLGAGLAAVGAGLASLGVGNVFAKYLEGALRNPGAADGQQGRLFIGFAHAKVLLAVADPVARLLDHVLHGLAGRPWQSRLPGGSRFGLQRGRGFRLPGFRT